MRILPVLLAVLVMVSCDLIAASQLESAVVKALKDDPRTASSTFGVSLQEDGEIMITGDVVSDVERAAVTEIAKSVEGVGIVLNRCAIPESGGGLMQDTVVTTPYF